MLGAFLGGMNPWGLFQSVPQRVIPSFLVLGCMERALSEGAGLAAYASTGCSIPTSHQANRCDKDPGSLLLQPCPAIILSNTQCLALIGSIRSFLSASAVQQVEGCTKRYVFSLALQGVMVHVMGPDQCR